MGDAAGSGFGMPTLELEAISGRWSTSRSGRAMLAKVRLAAKSNTHLLQAAVASEYLPNGAVPFSAEALAVQSSAEHHTGCLFHLPRHQHGDLRFFNY
jgi:hypothetical protein